ncbi:putative membrane protein [Candidatus Filomicrobium marinum]|uniref:Putative membrane protein n=1 Tax=Candidatus Filomicrobium marinum TaxID=1608628 RepID=A0A0D6JCS0_9HYPH|nr:hypothetical protein [Candidatus Filomicrobium marinum]CFX11994.1 putative membrane protein [Candidatus Filomicrobium marinum]CPR17373.1 putative membrane protein [Candidatus Filomicrobium marinum]
MLTVLLAKVLGIFMIIVGAAVVVRRHYFISVIDTFIEQRLTRLVLSMVELLAGLFLVVSHNDWSSPPAILITVCGWLAVIEATTYLFLPDAMFAKFLRALRNPTGYAIGGLVSVVLGLYLAGYGFGWL